MARTAAVIGGGVIGGGWAARFLLMGWNVRIFDPDPQAERKLEAVLANARVSLPGLADAAMPAEGRLTRHVSIAEAVAGADWVSESVPERLELKHRIYAEIQAANPTVPIGSSTSGFKPSDLQANAARPETIVVSHPYNPVYLLPLVELVASPATPPETLAQATEILSSVGMVPLQIRAEIDAHVGDRLLEAVWREALWLVRDGVATTEDIDEVIRLSFGLRWAQMGLFETYRIAGGEAGMRHFLAQFGPALKWPWTKLMDVPDLDDALIDRIAGQSDAQSGAHSIRDLERIRDRNLVGIMRALKWQGWGAGAVLKDHDRRLGLPEIDINRPLIMADRAVPLDWTDYNGHMNEAKYLQAFGDATDRFMELVGVTPEYLARGLSYFTVETHIRHLGEVRAGARIRIETLCLDGAGKRMHLFHRMLEGDRLLATGEHMLIHVSLETRRACLPEPALMAKIGEIAAAHAGLDRPEGIGAAVGRR